MANNTCLGPNFQEESHHQSKGGQELFRETRVRTLNSLGLQLLFFFLSFFLEMWLFFNLLTVC